MSLWRRIFFSACTAGLLNAQVDFTPVDSSGQPIGADFAALWSEAGWVANAAVQWTADGILFQYRAPTERACLIDVRMNNGPWERTADKGGALPRTVKIVTRAADESVIYSYRILCYFSQTDSGFADTIQFYVPGWLTSGTLRGGSTRRR